MLILPRFKKKRFKLNNWLNIYGNVKKFFFFRFGFAQGGNLTKELGRLTSKLNSLFENIMKRARKVIMRKIEL